VGEVLRLRKEEGVGTGPIAVAPAVLARLLGRVGEGRLSRNAAKQVFERLWQEGGSEQDVDRLMADMGLEQLSDETALAGIARDVLAQKPEEAAAWRAGKDELTGFFMGQVMKATGGSADPHLTRQVLEALRKEGPG